MISEPPSEEELRILSRYDVILANALLLQEEKGWTWEETVSFALIHALKDRDRLIEALILEHSRLPHLIIKDKT